MSNEQFATQFSEEDRLFFQQMNEKPCNDRTVIETALANPLDEIQPG